MTIKLLNLSKNIKYRHIQQPRIQTSRKLFTQAYTKKSNAYATAIATAIATLVGASAIEVDKQKDQALRLTQMQARDIFYEHITGNSNLDLIEPAKVLGYYGYHADEEKKFYRGEKLYPKSIKEMEQQLGEVLELKKNTSITDSHNVANNFTERLFFEQIKDFFIDTITGNNNHEKRMPVIYDVIVPKDFKFIKIPSNTYIDHADDSCGYLNEHEYVLPKGTLIKVTKSDTEQSRFTIHVLSDEDV